MTSKRDNTLQSLKLFWHHIARYPRCAGSLALVIPLTVLVEQFIPPIILANILNRLAHGNYDGHHVWASFGSSLVTYAVLLFVGSGGWRLIDVLAWKLEGGVQRDLANRVYDHLLDQSANFHANTFGGSLVSQTSKLLGAYIRFADTTMFQVIPLAAGLVSTFVILAPRAPLFVCLLFLFSAFFIITALFVTRKVRHTSAKLAEQESKQTGYLADSVTNIMTIKSFAGGSFERRAFQRITDDTHVRTMEVMRASQKQMVYFGLISRAISVLALVMAVVSVMLFNANVATAFLIFSYTNSLVNALWTFCNNSLRNYNRAFGDAGDMARILAVTPEILDPADPEEVRMEQGKIEFKNVTFSHDGADDALFNKLSMIIKPGEKVGLVGHSGSGKTTFTRLLLRFSDIQSGAITIDGQNIVHVTQDDLRRHIAYVSQEPLLFHRSIRENIAYGRPDATDEEVIAAAKMASAHDFVATLPQGYDTLVGERGVKLSGGQRQRIAIARAMLKNAPILLLDEATSALDSESEVLIQQALWKLMEGRTAIVIAHRLSTIQKMDRIVVLSKGKIVEQGSHKELIKKSKGTYAKLWAHQSGGFMED